MINPNVQRTLISPKNPAKYYIGDEADIKVSGHTLTINAYRFSSKDEDHPTLQGDIGEVEVITTGVNAPTRIGSGLIPLTEKLPSCNRPAYRNNSHRILIRNFTHYTVYSVDRNGMKTADTPYSFHTTYPRPEHQNCVVIREEYYYETAKAARASLALMRKTHVVKGLVANKLIIKLEESERFCSLGCCLIVDYVIHESKLHELGTIYHANTDRVISFSDNVNALEHPCSPDYIPAALCNGPTGDKDMFATFRYVSRKPNAQPLYTRLAGQITKLMPCAASGEITFANSEKVDDEFYYLDEYVLANVQQAASHINKLAAPGTSAPPSIIYRPIVIPVGDGMEKFGIFRNEADATKEFSDQSQRERKHEEAVFQLKTDLARLKNEYDLLNIGVRETDRRHNERVDELKNDIRRQAVQHKEELDRKDVIIEDLKKANHKEMEELKEKREQITHKTKTTHEYVKIFFAVVAGILAIIPIYLKFRTANPVPIPV